MLIVVIVVLFGFFVFVFVAVLFCICILQNQFKGSESITMEVGLCKDTYAKFSYESNNDESK